MLTDWAKVTTLSHLDARTIEETNVNKRPMTMTRADLDERLTMLIRILLNAKALGPGGKMVLWQRFVQNRADETPDYLLVGTGQNSPQTTGKRKTGGNPLLSGNFLMCGKINAIRR
ncbi:MAG: hypothetical protein IPN69_11200 [Acidobacteria bacterium]|nr:hypothetical protein [Acidobacteriota bacterium]